MCFLYLPKKDWFLFKRNTFYSIRFFDLKYTARSSKLLSTHLRSHKLELSMKQDLRIVMSLRKIKFAHI